MSRSYADEAVSALGPDWIVVAAIGLLAVGALLVAGFVLSMALGFNGSDPALRGQQIGGAAFFGVIAAAFGGVGVSRWAKAATLLIADDRVVIRRRHRPDLVIERIDVVSVQVRTGNRSELGGQILGPDGELGSWSTSLRGTPSVAFAAHGWPSRRS